MTSNGTSARRHFACQIANLCLKRFHPNECVASVCASQPSVSRNPHSALSALRSTSNVVRQQVFWPGAFDCFAAILTMVFTTFVTLQILRYFKQTPIVWIYLLEFAPSLFKAKSISLDADFASRRNRLLALLGGLIGCTLSVMLVLSSSRH